MRIFIVYLQLLLTVANAQTNSKASDAIPTLPFPFLGFIHISPENIYARHEVYVAKDIMPHCDAEKRRKDLYAIEYEKIAKLADRSDEEKSRMFSDLREDYDSEALARCLKNFEDKEPFGLRLDLYSEPNRASKKLGQLVMRYGDNSSEFQYYKLEYVSATGETKTFIPDLYSHDNPHDDPSYHSALERRGDWIKFPKLPFPSEVWADFGSSEDFGPVKIKTILEIGVFKLKTASVTGPAKIKKINHGKATGETIEIPRCDCQENKGDNKAKKSAGPRFLPKRFSIPVDELLDESGHFNGMKVDFPECYCC